MERLGTMKDKLTHKDVHANILMHVIFEDLKGMNINNMSPGMLQRLRFCTSTPIYWRHLLPPYSVQIFLP